MSTGKEFTNRRLSRREGTSIEPDTDNDNSQEQPPSQKHQHQEIYQLKKPIESKEREISLPSSLQPNLNREIKNIQDDDEREESRKLPAKDSETAMVTTIKKPSSSVKVGDDVPRQVIAVSANKNPTAFFQLARKFLMTNEMCDLSALEGAIVSAVDAAHLLERSQLASIVRIHTSYVTVEPKRRKQVSQKQQQKQTDATDYVPSALKDVSSSRLSLATKDAISVPTTVEAAVTEESTASIGTSTDRKQPPTLHTAASRKGKATGSSGVRELRRARILISVKRTDSYKRWLNENPLNRQAIIAGDDIVSDSTSVTNVTGPIPPTGGSKKGN